MRTRIGFIPRKVPHHLDQTSYPHVIHIMIRTEGVLPVPPCVVLIAKTMRAVTMLQCPQVVSDDLKVDADDELLDHHVSVSPMR